MSQSRNQLRQNTDCAAPSSAATSAPPALACWNDTGIFGKGSCPELHRFVHCRNCAVYSNAGIQLLDRPLPPNYRQELTQHFAREKNLLELSSVSIILFRLGSDWLALPTRCFQEITEMRPVHSLPHQRPWVLGLANVRGELLVCISLHDFLGLARPSAGRSRDDRRRLLVLNWNGNHVCFPADEVQGPRRFYPQDLKSPPATLARSAPTYTQGVLHCDQQTVKLLEPNLFCSALDRSFT